MRCCHCVADVEEMYVHEMFYVRIRATNVNVVLSVMDLMFFNFAVQCDCVWAVLLAVLWLSQCSSHVV